LNATQYDAQIQKVRLPSREAGTGELKLGDWNFEVTLMVGGQPKIQELVQFKVVKDPARRKRLNQRRIIKHKYLLDEAQFYAMLT
jgi:hypothetical protein